MAVKKQKRTGRRIPPSVDMLAACESTGVKGLAVALLGIFDTDGSAQLSRGEFTVNAGALGYEASDSAWASLRSRFGLTRPNAPQERLGSPRSDSDEHLDLGLIADHFKSKYDPILEGILRQMMGGMVYLSARVTSLEEVLDQVHGASLRDRERKLEAVVRRWHHGILSVAFDGWCKVVKGQRELLNRTARHLLNAQLSMVWKRWREVVAEAQEQRQIVAKALGRMRNRVVARSFDAWKSVWEDVRRQWEVAARAVQRMRNRHSAIAFETWRDAVETAKAHRAAVLKVLVRMRNRLLHVAFEGWHHATQAAKWQREQMARVTARLRNLAVVLSFEAWRDDVQATVNSRREVLRRVSNRMVNRTLTLAFERWKGQVVEQKQQIARAKQHAARMINGLLGKCFDAWTAFEKELKRIKRRATYAIGPGRILFITYSTWAAHVREVRQLGLIDSRLAANIEAYLDAKGLALDVITKEVVFLERKVARLPIDLNERMAEARLLEERMLEQFKMEAELSRKLEEDRLKREAERQNEQRVKQVIKRMLFRALWTCFEAWVLAVKEANAKLQLAESSRRNVSLSKGWRRWKKVWEVLHEPNLKKKLETKARRDRDAQLLAGLRSVGSTWFQEMQLRADSIRPHYSSHLVTTEYLLPADGSGIVSQSTSTVAPSPGAKHEAPDAHTITSVLELMDQRYIRMATGARGGAQLDHDLRLLEQRLGNLCRAIELDPYMKHILANIMMDPTLRTTIDKSEREQSVPPRPLRPLRAPPHFDFDALSVEQIEKMMDGAGAPARWLRPSQSRANLRTGVSAPTLTPVRDTRNTTAPPDGDGSPVFSINSLLQERLMHSRVGDSRG